MITGCSVTLSNGNIGNATQDYNGGFVGIQTGTRIFNSSVSGLASVQANNGAGGFAGLERDAIIKGLLNNAGVKLYDLDVKSRQENCKVNSSNLAITATASYAGGFNGIMANSISSASTEMETLVMPPRITMAVLLEYRQVQGFLILLFQGFLV